MGAAISCREIDPVEDTESLTHLFRIELLFCVAGISIRLRILKVHAAYCGLV